MADLLFGFPCVRQRRARIYRFNDNILIYSNQKLHTRYKFGRASIQYKPHRGGFTEENKLLLRFETNRPRADSTTMLCVWWHTESCWRCNWSIQSPPFHWQSIANATLETITGLTRGKLHYGILIVD